MPAANDAFASATLITGASGSITPVHYDGVADPATSETGEAVYGTGETLWWTWVAPSSGTFVFTTAGSPSDDADPYGLDTKLQVLTSISAVVAQNDDDPTDSTTVNSRVQFTATAGVTYYVQVDQYGPNQAGTIHLAWHDVPPVPTASSWTSSGTFSPFVAFPADDVTVTGTHLDVVTSVTVGGVSQSFTASSSVSLVVHIDGNAVSGAVIVANGSGSAHPTHLGSDLTVLYPGPWVQPTDEPGATDSLVLPDIGLVGSAITSPTEPDFAGEPSGGRYLSIAVEPTHPQPAPTWSWSAALPVVALYPPDPTYTMPPYDATADVAAAPHAVDYETETVPPVPTSDLTLTWRIYIQVAHYLESTDNRTLAEDLWQEHVQFRRLDASDWDGYGLVARYWPAQTWLAALPVDHDQPFRNDGQGLLLNSVGSWTNNDADLDRFSVPTTYGDPQTVTFADLGSGRAWVATFDSFVGASSIAVPYMDPSETFAVGNGTGYKSLIGDPQIHATWTYRPPRYRILYDAPPTTAMLRRRQQSARSGSAPRRRQFANRTGSPRRGPGAAP